MKTYKELKEGFFSKKKVVTAKELALKNNAPKLVDGNAQPDKQENARKTNKASMHDKQDWKFEHIENFQKILEMATQAHTSAGTSLNQVSSGIKHAVKTGLIKPNSINVDHGGGKYDSGSEHVKNNVENAKLHVHDPFNRSEEHNTSVKKETKGKADYAGMHNVLNVIKEPEHREAALHELKSFMKPKTGVGHVTVYEGDKSSNGRISKADKGNGSSWQEHRKTESYMPEVKKVFPEETHNVVRKGSNIIITQK